MAGNIYKRGPVWWGRAQFRGKEFRQSLKTGDRAVAERRVKKWLDDLECSAWGETPVKSFEDAALHFVEAHLPRLKPSSAARYIHSLRTLTPHFEGRRLDQIDRAALMAFTDYRKRGGVTQSTIRRDLACLSSIYSEAAAEWDIEAGNPVTRFLRAQQKRGGLREGEARTRYLTHDEESRLLAACAPDLAAAVAFAIDTGLRREEQFGLTWRDVDLRSGTVTITASRSKGGKRREIPLLNRSAQILAQMPRRLRLAGGPDWIWCKCSGERYPHRRKAFSTAVRASGLEDVRWHDLRRTCGCRRLQDDEMRMEQVRDWLGHSSVVLTERAYAFLRIDDLRTSAQKPARERRINNAE